MSVNTSIPLAERQRKSGVKSMGQRPAIWCCVPGIVTEYGRTEGLYQDAEVEIQYEPLKAGACWTAGERRHDFWSPNTLGKALFAVFGNGDGMCGQRRLSAGALVVAGSPVELRIDAGHAGLDFFAAVITTAAVVSGTITILERSRLEPFAAEGIIVTRGTEFIFAPTLDLAEVIVPPGVTTSEHDLGVNERYLVLEGEGTMVLDGHESKVDSGCVVAIPSGTMQFIRNDSPVAPLRFYCLCTPPFTPATYGPGRHAGSVPAGFDLDDWWRRHADSYGATLGRPREFP